MDARGITLICQALLTLDLARAVASPRSTWACLQPNGGRQQRDTSRERSGSPQLGPPVWTPFLARLPRSRRRHSLDPDEERSCPPMPGLTS